MMNDPSMAVQRDQGSLAGKTALVLGGTDGIGWELNQLLAWADANIILHGQDEARIDMRADELRRRSPALAVHHLCYRFTPVNLAGFFELLPSLPAPDVLVVAFGPFIQKPLTASSVADWNLMACLNLALPGALTSACIPAMQKKGWGRIVLFGGTQTDQIRATKTNTAYAAAKTGLNVLCKSIAREYADAGIACSLFCPGLVQRQNDKAVASSSALPFPFIAPYQLAKQVFDIAIRSDGLANGACISLDGGLTLEQPRRAQNGLEIS
jgi:NAD(P)-dependent dehydrogenase (short-subunit alcohol dehydrogenase family)